jgi:CheY-like chemotaxis protein
MMTACKRVLLVDDEPSHRFLLRLLFLDLWSLDVVISEASNGEEAVLLTQQWQPHLILMDLKMPQMDGYEAIQQIRTLERTQATGASPAYTIRIIATTAAVSKVDRSRAFAAGCNDFVCKPYELRELKHTIEQHLAPIDYYFRVREKRVLVPSLIVSEGSSPNIRL